VQVAAELVSWKAKVGAQKTKLLASQTVGALGNGLGDGTVDFLDARDQDIFVAAMGALGDFNALQDDVPQAAFKVAVILAARFDRLPALRTFVGGLRHQLLLLKTVTRSFGLRVPV
jgi:hypothetical protein